MGHFCVGLTALILGACGIVFWWAEFGEFLRGSVPMMLVLVGLAAVGTGLRNRWTGAELKGPEKAEDRTAPRQTG